MKISKLIKLLVLQMLLLPVAAFAQGNHYKSTIYVGAKGGVGFSEVFFSPSTQETFNPGFNGGLQFRYIEEKHFGLIAEVNFVQRGWKENFKDLPFRYSRTIDYIEIPALAHIYFGNRGRFYINAGPEICFMIGEAESANFNPAEMESISGFPNTNRTNAQMTMKVQNRIDYGISAGLGGEFFINPKNSLTAEVRAYYGLGNIFSAKRADKFHLSNQLTISASIGYWLRLK